MTSTGIIVVTSMLAAVAVSAQQPAPAPAAEQRSARADARLELTGTWVSVVTEDWRWRMVMPPPGDYSSVPISNEGRRVADLWEPAKDEAAGTQCKAYGVGGIMRMPGRLRISWDNDSTLKIETDAGTQTRLLRFGGAQPAGKDGGWQGFSAAEWQGLPPNPNARRDDGGIPDNARAGRLRVRTTGMRPGYLRQNGVPYSANAVITEYFHRTREANGDEWLVVTTIVEDRQYLVQPFITSSHFKKEPDNSKWNPTPCRSR